MTHPIFIKSKVGSTYEANKEYYLSIHGVLFIMLSADHEKNFLYNVYMCPSSVK